MKIHIARNNQQLGQFSLDEVNAGIANGRFNPSDLAWWEGAPGWVRLDTAPGVVVPANRPPPMPAPPMAPAASAKSGSSMSTKTVMIIAVAAVLVLAVPVIGLLAAIAIPNFVKARTTAQQKACITNLKQIEGAVQQWALENRKPTSDTYSLSDPALLAFLKGSVLPACPAGGVYSAAPWVGDSPRCSIPRHQL